MTKQGAQPTLQFVWLEVADLARAAAFYGETLGFPIVETTDAFIVADLTSAKLYLAQGQPIPTNIYLAIAVPDIDLLYQRMLEAGLKVASPQDEGWARYIEYQDPDGYRLLLLTPISQDDEGTA
ncbi:MAG TPA: VOC family protein [Anaerolineae bacterium]|nr:VOC family protein [Anaerolineae bacterium]